jgi:hypothetical protein
MTAAKASTVTVTLEFSKETKNTFRFDDSNEDSAIPSLYVRKSAFKGTAPTSITVTVA